MTTVAWRWWTAELQRLRRFRQPWRSRRQPPEWQRQLQRWNRSLQPPAAIEATSLGSKHTLRQNKRRKKQTQFVQANSSKQTFNTNTKLFNTKQTIENNTISRNKKHIHNRTQNSKLLSTPIDVLWVLLHYNGWMLHQHHHQHPSPSSSPAWWNNTAQQQTIQMVTVIRP